MHNCFFQLNNTTFIWTIEVISNVFTVIFGNQSCWIEIVFKIMLSEPWEQTYLEARSKERPVRVSLNSNGWVCVCSSQIRVLLANNSKKRRHVLIPSQTQHVHVTSAVRTVFDCTDRRNSQAEVEERRISGTFNGHNVIHVYTRLYLHDRFQVWEWKPVSHQHRQRDRDWTTFTQRSSCLTNHPKRKPRQSHICTNSPCEWGLWIVSFFYMVMIQPWKSKRKQKNIHNVRWHIHKIGLKTICRIFSSQNLYVLQDGGTVRQIQGIKS